MAASTSPIFFAAVHNEFPHADGDGGAAGALKTQNTNVDGSGTLLTLFTGAANGSGVLYVVMRPAGTNIATVARFFMYDGTNTQLLDEMTLNSTTAASAAALQPYVWTPPRGIVTLQNAHKLKMTLGTTVSAGYFCSAFGGDY